MADMQRRQLQIVADIIAGLDKDVCNYTKEHIAVEFADKLAKHNANFRRSQFLRACRVEDPAASGD